MRISVRLVVGLLLALPTIVFSLGAYKLWQFVGAARDSSVPGVVVSSSVEELVDPGSRRGEPTTNTYRPRVTYSYFAQGRQRTGSAVTLFQEAGSEAWARDVASGYAPGDRVPVFLHRHEADRPYLTRGGGVLIPLTLIALGGLPLGWFASAKFRRGRADTASV